MPNFLSSAGHFDRQLSSSGPPNIKVRISFKIFHEYFLAMMKYDENGNYIWLDVYMSVAC